MSRNHLAYDQNLVRKTGHSFMFGTGMSASPAPRKVELPIINSPQSISSSLPKQTKFEQESKIMEKVLY